MPSAKVMSKDEGGAPGMIIPSHKNRRRHERTSREFLIKWEDQAVVFQGITLDICPGGLFVITSQVLPTNCLLQLEIILEDGSSTTCRGKVAWVNRGQLDHYPPGFGVEFLNLPVETQLMLLDKLSDYQGFDDQL
jgi:Tfp pilus assembly protein PilZ